MENNIWCYKPSFMKKICSVVSEELRWQADTWWFTVFFFLILEGITLIKDSESKFPDDMHNYLWCSWHIPGSSVE